MSDLSLKKNIDLLQSRFQCCGINSPSDWLKMGEVDLSEGLKDFIDSDEFIKNIERKNWNHCKKHTVDSLSPTCYIPFSCCKVDELSCSPWNIVLEEEFHQGKNLINQFYQEGCVPRLKSIHKTSYETIILGFLIGVQLIAASLTLLIKNS